MSVDSSVLALECVANGRGVAIVNRLFSQSFIQRGTLIEPFKQALPMQNNFYVVAQSDPLKQKQIELFYTWLMSITT